MWLKMETLLLQNYPNLMLQKPLAIEWIPSHGFADYFKEKVRWFAEKRSIVERPLPSANGRKYEISIIHQLDFCTPPEGTV